MRRTLVFAYASSTLPAKMKKIKNTLASNSVIILQSTL